MVATLRGAAIGVLLCAASATAFAQGFMIKPMRIEVAPRAGETIEQKIEVLSTLQGRPQIVKTRVALLSQDDYGTWMAARPDSADAEELLRRSAIEWMQVEPQEALVEAGARSDVTLRLSVPTRARGFYSAALLISSESPDAKPGTVQMVVQFLVPIQIHVQGPAPRERLELGQMDMRFRPEGETSRPGETAEKVPATTLIDVEVQNAGDTYARMSGQVNVLRQVGEQWQNVGNVRLRRLGLLPGKRITLQHDLDKRLPSGEYRLEAVLYVDGRFRGRHTHDVTFEGDPTVTDVAADVPLQVPGEISVDVPPGAMRSARLEVSNPSTVNVKVNCWLETPPELRGMALGELDATEFSAADWSQVSPAEFQLRGGASRTLGLAIRRPATENTLTNYYAYLHVAASYPDGQAAGHRTVLVHVHDPAGKEYPRAQATQVLVARADENAYSVSAQFANAGNVHFKPTATAAVQNAEGQTVVETELSSETGTALPLTLMRFSGDLDFASVETGDYHLVTTLKFGEEELRQQLVLKVEDAEEGKLVTVVDGQDASKEPAAEPGTAPKDGDDAQ